MHLQPLWRGQASERASSKGNRKVSGIKEGRAEAREGREKASKEGVGRARRKQTRPHHVGCRCNYSTLEPF